MIICARYRRIKQFEIIITSHDLKTILMDVAGRSFLLALKVKNREEVIQDINVSEFNAQEGIVTVCSPKTPSKRERISCLDIERLEFPSFYKYGGEAAKNFNVE
jgi:hypothetical protein